MQYSLIKRIQNLFIQRFYTLIILLFFRLQPPPDGRPEFKKPHHAHPHHNTHNSSSSSHNLHHHQIRGGYQKSKEGKPPYGGRGGYPGQPVKHGGGGGTATHRSNGIQPAKGPPPLSSPATSSSSGLGSSSVVNRLHGGVIGERHARHPYEQVGHLLRGTEKCVFIFLCFYCSFNFAEQAQQNQRCYNVLGVILMLI